MVTDAAAGSTRKATLAAIVRDHPYLALLNAAVLVVLSAAIVWTHALYENRLSMHQGFRSSKVSLGREVMGASAYVTAPQALAQNHLNLGAWFGFQEVLFRDPIDAAAMEFRLRVEPDGYVHILYDHRSDGFSGVRFSSRPDSPAIVYSARPDGEFTAITKLDLEPLGPDVWHRAALNFTADPADITLDGVKVASVRRTAGMQRLGLRGGQRNAWIDDVIVTGRDGRVRAEDFTNRRQRWVRLAFVLLAAFVAAAALTVSSASPERTLIRLQRAGVALGCVIGAAYAFQYVRGGTYRPLPADNRRAETDSINWHRKSVLDDIHARYAPRVPANVFRILALGASQTWGAGARTQDETWVRQLETLLNESARGGRVECVNAGVSGFLA